MKEPLMMDDLNSDLPLLDQLKLALKAADFSRVDVICGHLLQEDEFRTDVHDLIGYYSFRLGDHQRACQHFIRLTELMPRESRGYVNLGATYNRMKDFESALTVLRKAIQCDARNPDAYFNLGTAQKGLNRLDLAISSYKEALKLQKDSVDTLFNLAILHRERGMNRQAKEYYAKVLKINPQHQLAATQLAEMQKTEISDKQSASPFGRLVDVKELSQQVSGHDEHLLTDQERIEDREAINRISRSISKAAKETAFELKTHYEPLLLKTIRALIDFSEHAEEFSKTCTQYQQYRPRFDEYRRHLKRAVLELRGHEEFKNAPDVADL